MIHLIPNKYSITLKKKHCLGDGVGPEDRHPGGGGQVWGVHDHCLGHGVGPEDRYPGGSGQVWGVHDHCLGDGVGPEDRYPGGEFGVWGVHQCRLLGSRPGTGTMESIRIR